MSFCLLLCLNKARCLSAKLIATDISVDDVILVGRPDKLLSVFMYFLLLV